MKKILCLAIWTMLILISCQKEEIEVINPNEDNAIPRSSQLAKLMKNIVTHDGSFDDIVDRGNCFSIDFPYVIFINNLEEEFVINDTSIYTQFTEIEFIKIQYPITVTLFDHTKVTINNTVELATLAEKCGSQKNDIECIDFVYPFDLSLFNNRTNSFEVIEVIHDSQLFRLMENADSDKVMSINYPINLRLHDGEEVIAEHNSGLLKTILESAFDCR